MGYSHVGLDFGLVLVFCCGQKEDKRFVVFVGVSKVVVILWRGVAVWLEVGV